jgi:hypothetical protein
MNFFAATNPLNKLGTTPRQLFDVVSLVYIGHGLLAMHLAAERSVLVPSVLTSLDFEIQRAFRGFLQFRERNYVGIFKKLCKCIVYCFVKTYLFESNR